MAKFEPQTGPRLWQNCLWEKAAEFGSNLSLILAMDLWEKAAEFGLKLSLILAMDLWEMDVEFGSKSSVILAMELNLKRP